MKSTDSKSRVLEMVGLYQKDPQAFEKMRAEIIHQMIEDLPEEYRRRAYGMQFQLEMRLQRYRDPISRMNAMIAMFWEQFEEFKNVLNDPRQVLSEKEAARQVPAKILSLEERRKRH
jgi:hypothetical protein